MRVELRSDKVRYITFQKRRSAPFRDLLAYWNENMKGHRGEEDTEILKSLSGVTSLATISWT